MDQGLSNAFPSNVNGKASAAETVAAREHVAQKRPIRAHVIVTHDFPQRTARIIDTFNLAGRLPEDVLDFVHRELVQDMLDDIATLEAELADIKRWALAQRSKRPTPIRP